MNSELKEYMSKCETCNKYKNSQQKESLMSHELSDRPWEKVGVDIFELKRVFSHHSRLFQQFLGN